MPKIAQSSPFAPSRNKKNDVRSCAGAVTSVLSYGLLTCYDPFSSQQALSSPVQSFIYQVSIAQLVSIRTTFWLPMVHDGVTSVFAVILVPVYGTKVVRTGRSHKRPHC
jgi:hypothetical protein